MSEAAPRCPLCATGADLLPTNGDRVEVICPACGHFTIVGSAISELRSSPLTPRQAANARGWMAEGSLSLITSHELPRLMALATPSVQSRFDRLLLRLQKDTPALGGAVELGALARQQAYYSATYCVNSGELRYLIESLQARGFVKYPGGKWEFPVLTPEAYAYIDEHLARNAESPVGFCAMWFDDEVLPLWTASIRPGIEAAGYEPLRLDQHEHNNRIDEEIIASIRRARFVVADLTAHRQGVYFEAGFAMGLGLPVIWMVRDNDLDATHFDNRQFNFIVWSAGELGAARDRIQNRIEATIGKGPRPPT
jgi:nucleoside 2-deoxyribosyltransferase